MLTLFCILVSTDLCSGDIRLTCLSVDHTLKFLNKLASYFPLNIHLVSVRLYFFQSVVACFVLEVFYAGCRICFFFFWKTTVLLIHFIAHFSERSVWIILHKDSRASLCNHSEHETKIFNLDWCCGSLILVMSFMHIHITSQNQFWFYLTIAYKNSFISIFLTGYYFTFLKDDL